MRLLQTIKTMKLICLFVILLLNYKPSVGQDAAAAAAAAVDISATKVPHLLTVTPHYFLSP
jgi:hypothetical protein